MRTAVVKAVQIICLAMHRYPLSCLAGVVAWVNLLMWVAAAVLGAPQIVDFADIASPALAVTTALVAEVGSFVADGSGPGPRSQLVAVMQGVWGGRLALFLLLRLITFGKDQRLESLRHGNLGRAFLFAGHAVWIWSISIPCVLSASVRDPSSTLRTIDQIGIAFFTLGFLTEVLADQTKLAHKFFEITNGRRSHCAKGLWEWSQHPNYFGEIMLWIGVTLTAWSDVRPVALRPLLLIAPGVTMGMLLFVSGVPLSDLRMRAKYNMSEEYRRYRRTTSKLVPMPPWVYQRLRRVLSPDSERTM
eukprot:Plantae.Rhodophyta-Rhodochaete_pulchella.ctg30424.p1 GENE.Plantae.Rhodophyta-Rhodochaete_pulchella.ctg30424~~Plantae.Rhodophyta-Rhodochaete_pulchella.ctg30424.p1  ORF type:complete len:303 (+),score=25.21 Plantae.Rhodophyta-Rhodochaete_pulchella.ctg30424:145-1053(+)